MFRSLVSPNLTSLRKLLQTFVCGIGKRCMSECLCTQQPKCTPPPVSDIKVTICGANGQIGAILAFLLKQSPLVNIMKLYDLDSTYGMALDISHIDTQCRVQSFSGCSDLYEAMCESQIIVICAGVGRAPGMSLNDLFEYNAPVVKQLSEAICTVNPKAFVAILTNPINSLVPMVSNIFKKMNAYDSKRIFGITTIDSMRAACVLANDVLKGEEDPGTFLVPVIGGHSPETMLPIWSQATPCVEIPNSSYACLNEKVQQAASLVTNIKQKGGPRLSVALGASRFVNNLIRAILKENNVLELAYVYTNVIPGICYFASPFELGPCGIKNNLGLLKVHSQLEKPCLKAAMEQLKLDIERGESYCV